MQVILKKDYKSIPSGITFDLPDFSIITGRNGSGKSHLLDALANAEMSIVSDGGKTLQKIQLIPFGGLNPQIDELCDPQSLIQTTKNWWLQIEEMQKQLISARQRGEIIEDPVKQFLPRWGQNSPLIPVVSNIMKRVSKKFEDLTEDHIYYNLNIIETNQSTLFASQLALIFKTYHVRSLKNQFNQFLNEKNGTEIPTISDAEFIAQYGPKPWDLVNEILAKAELPYKVISPELSDVDTTYKLRLVDSNKGIDISANDLSTGEKVLMSLALAIYNTHESVGKPDLLILDEPDAPLHPRYSKLLIDTLREIIVQKAGVKVILTTHSPSTVAMCPDNSLFNMDRESKIPNMISVSQGIELLTEGIPHLSVSIEGRRQIFVESKYDVLYFQKLYQLIERLVGLKYQPIFLEPHSGTSNCVDVEIITNRLYEAGSDLVRGIVDWDGKKTANHPIYVLGEGGRYSIENYILDPLYIALSLVRAGKKTFQDFSIASAHNYVEAINLSAVEAQTMCDHILGLANISITGTVPCELHNGWKLELPSSFLNMRGHDWEDLLLTKIPELNAVSIKRGDAGLKLGVLQTIEEFPRYLSVDIYRTLSAIS